MTQGLQLGVAFTFGLLFVIALLVLAIRFPNPTSFQHTVFRVILALAAAGIAAMLPGAINVEFNPAAGAVVRSSGALAFFVIVYFWSPTQLVSTPSDNGSHEIGRGVSSRRQALAEKLVEWTSLVLDLQREYRRSLASRTGWPGEHVDLVERENSVYGMILADLDTTQPSEAALLKEIMSFRQIEDLEMWHQRRDKLMLQLRRALPGD